MTSHHKDSLLDEATVSVTTLGEKIMTASWRLVILAVLALFYFQGNNILNSLVSKNPDLVLARETALAAKSLADATSLANTQLVASQSRIFDALKQDHIDQTSTNLALATLIEHVSGLEKQLDRVELKQDDTPSQKN